MFTHKNKKTSSLKLVFIIYYNPNTRFNVIIYNIIVLCIRSDVIYYRLTTDEYLYHIKNCNMFTIELKSRLIIQNTINNLQITKLLSEISN